MAKKQSLTFEDFKEIKRTDEKLREFRASFESLSQFKIGDYLIVFGINENMRTTITNSYGAPRKFQVIYVSDESIPYIQEISLTGNVIGEVIAPMDNFLSYNDHFGYIDTEHQYLEFQLDPDYADSILLGEKYDPSVFHKTRQTLYKDITKHNKQCKVNTRTIKSICEAFLNVKVGDTLWSSVNGSYTVVDNKVYTRDDFENVKDLYTRVKGPFVPVLVVVDKNGLTKTITPDFFHNKALYTQRPRSYKELNS